MHTQTLDNFDDLSVWSPITSGQARLTLTPIAAPAQSAMQLAFDFAGGGGFVVARRELALTLPDSYALLLDIRAAAPANAFEFKLVDSSGANVWRYRDEAFDFTTDWRTLRIPSKALVFGWGPAGGGVAHDIGAIEIVIAAGPGGSGELTIANLRLEDRTPCTAPLISASSAQLGHAATCAMDGDAATSWRAAQLPAYLNLDFQEERDYGGLIVRWAEPTARQFAIYASDDGSNWRSLYVAPRAAGLWNAVYLPDGCSRWLRLVVDAPISPKDIKTPISSVIAIELQPEGFARSINDFFHQLAAAAPRGHYPRWLYREQSYWTPVDVLNGKVPALFNEEGMIEIRRAGFAVEPVLIVGETTLITWANCAIEQQLVRQPLPLPQAVWRWRDATGTKKLQLTVTASANNVFDATCFQLSYQLENQSDTPINVRLGVLVRPFQVSPPWQHWRDIGGVSPIHTLAYRNGAIWVNDALALVPITPPSAFGAAAFDEGAITEALAAGALPAAHAVTDSFGYASGALIFEMTLAANECREMIVNAPSHDSYQLTVDSCQFAFNTLDVAQKEWALALDEVQFHLPLIAQNYLHSALGSLAHILITRNGAALQPGARRYTRSWIRDGAGMVAALLRFGRTEDAKAFIQWYAPFQSPNGNVPCCVDNEGADWLPEHDSHGQLIFVIAEYYRFTGDFQFIEELWPAVQRAVSYLEYLRAERLTAHYQTNEHRACFGLLPESVSHEGYLAHPVHSYWDDFWALRGLKDAVLLAQVMNKAEAAHFIALRDDFNRTLHASLLHTMTERGIDFLPGSVEWADPDPTATANALTLIDDLHQLPAAVLNRSFDLFMERFRAMHGEQPVAWTNYTPYEIRIIGALVRLGRRDDAHELAQFFLNERRPPEWNQWPEIAWRNSRAPGHQGDLPHAWISAEYCLVFRDFFVYERESDQSLVIGAGILSAWLDAGEITINALPTAYGLIDLQFQRLTNGEVTAQIGGSFRSPPGGIQLALPA